MGEQTDGRTGGKKENEYRWPKQSSDEQGHRCYRADRRKTDTGVSPKTFDATLSAVTSAFGCAKFMQLARLWLQLLFPSSAPVPNEAERRTVTQNCQRLRIVTRHVAQQSCPVFQLCHCSIISLRNATAASIVAVQTKLLLAKVQSLATLRCLKLDPQNLPQLLEKEKKLYQ